uniref:Uncharacterized protein n=1 Tax=Chromera velia CCMP2878 TaxID=1169474 RepID=A0A0G4FUJ0_9ALVE|eukprot:Cvel_18764.t1-p1 / transcript=Cvel_18764.t1 / gene=Cvel_18764 / organism=Chromera_velia_CCMP2878 / gene_product=hypothetical protein / transcript_product=hypothetical protein / location=Cvel_scaffold1574:35013-35999(-) / protein_length=329 / sequence_SO=supercontig / SO=protein_coding / is_pseudo=false
MGSSEAILRSCQRIMRLYEELFAPGGIFAGRRRDDTVRAGPSGGGGPLLTEIPSVSRAAPTPTDPPSRGVEELGGKVWWALCERKRVNDTLGEYARELFLHHLGQGDQREHGQTRPHQLGGAASSVPQTPQSHIPLKGGRQSYGQSFSSVAAGPTTPPPNVQPPLGSETAQPGDPGLQVIMAGGCHPAHSRQATPPQYTNGNPPQSHRGAQPGANIIPRLLISPPSQSSWQVTLPQETVAGQGATQQNTTQPGERRRAPSSSIGRNGKGGTHAAAVAAFPLAQGLSSSPAVAAGGSQAVASRRSGGGGVKRSLEPHLRRPSEVNEIVDT